VAKVISLSERKQTLVPDTIWEMAIDLFAEKGFDETTVEDITEAAGTSRRSFFRYFESKGDLIAQPILSCGSFVIDSIRKAPAALPSSELLRGTLLELAKNSAMDPRSRKVMEIATRYPEARKAQLARLTELQIELGELLSQRFKKTAKDRITARILASTILSTPSITFHSWFETGQPDISVTVDQVLASLSEVAGESCN
jgi:AcrR family transcriptional regulator